MSRCRRCGEEENIPWDEIRFEDLRSKLPEPITCVAVGHLPSNEQGYTVYLQDDSGHILGYQVLNLNDFAYGSDDRFQAQHQVYVLKPAKDTPGLVFSDSEQAKEACQAANQFFTYAIKNGLWNMSDAECYGGSEISFVVEKEFV
jgi:hypothetical protein